MYKSEISVSDLVQGVLSAINTVPEIPGQVVARHLHDLQNRLYVQILRPQRHISLSLQKQGDTKYFTMTNILPAEGEDAACIDDLCMVFADSERIFCADKAQFMVMSIPVYTRMGDKILLRNVSTDTVTVVYTVRPAPIGYTDSGGYSGEIRMPNGYVSLIGAGLRAELCRYVGDDDGYRRFASEYNDLLSDLRSCYLGQTEEKHA